MAEALRENTQDRDLAFVAGRETRMPGFRRQRHGAAARPRQAGDAEAGAGAEDGDRFAFRVPEGPGRCHERGRRQRRDGKGERRENR